MILRTIITVVSALLALSLSAADKPVGITPDLMEAAGISRNQDNSATINADFAKTSRPCPPFCIQPMYPFAPADVETVAELEMIDAAERIEAGDESLLIVDSRTPRWVEKGTIPGAVNVPFTRLNATAVGKDPDAVIEIVEDTFGAISFDGVWDFSQAKTLYLFCNGMWCGQSPASIRALLALGYPAHKLKYYRGGMQDWQILGLSVTK